MMNLQLAWSDSPLNIGTCVVNYFFFQHFFTAVPVQFSFRGPCLLGVAPYWLGVLVRPEFHISVRFADVFD